MSDVIIDVEDGLKRVMNNGKLYARLLTKFKEDTNLKEMEDAITAGDMEKAKVSAHTLKGLAANLSLIALQKEALEIETQIKSGSFKPDQIDVIKNVYSVTFEKLMR